MRKSLYFLLSIFCLASLITSCIKDETVDYSGYTKCAITSFSFKDIEWDDTVKNQYNEDSIFTTTIAGSDYPFTIDQERGLIYNVDSLPVGTPVNKVLVELVADGEVIYRHNNSTDSIPYYVNRDTINFTAPIHAIVFALNGSSTKEYTISLNVHKQHADSTQWTRHNGEWVGKDLQTPKAVTYGKSVAVFGIKDGKLMVTTAPQGSMNWSTPTEVSGISAEANYDNIVYFQQALYLIDNDMLYVSDDAMNWTKIQTNTPVSTLLGCNSKELFGAYDKSFIVSDDAMNWNKENTEYPEFIPDSNIFSYTSQYNTNQYLERTVTFGQISESTDTIAAVWYRDNGYQINYSNQWGYMYTSRDDNSYALPNLENLVVLYYKDYLIAFGNKSRNKGSARAFNQLYVSKDWGLTWKGQKDETKETYLELPSALYRNENEFAAYVDSEYNLWILMSKTGDVWCGYLNKMKFANKD